MNFKIYIVILLVLKVQIGMCQTSKIIGNDLYAPSKSEKARSYYNDGHNAMENRNYRKAIEFYKLAITEDPGYIDAYDNLALAYRQFNMLDSAACYNLISIKKFPKGTVARRNQAIVEEKRGQTDKAIAYLKEALEIDNKDPETYYGLMREYSIQKNFTEALVNGNKAEKYYSERNDPNIGDCYLMLCIINLFLNNKDQAKHYAQLAQNKGVKLDQAILDALK